MPAESSSLPAHDPAAPMVALSRLAGAVAHDYHALLSQILGSSEVAQQLLPLGFQPAIASRAFKRPAKKPRP